MFSLSTAALTGVMKGLTSYLIKLMLKSCLTYTHRRYAVMRFIVNHPSHAQYCQQNMLLTNPKGKKQRTANKLHVMFQHTHNALTIQS